MALKKSITDNHGHTSEHWYIMRYSVDRMMDYGVVQLGLWKDKTARLAGHEPTLTHEIQYRSNELIDPSGFVVYHKMQSHLLDKSLNQILNKIKENKYKVKAIEVDMTTAEDDD